MCVWDRIIWRVVEDRRKDGRGSGYEKDAARAGRGGGGGVLFLLFSFLPFAFSSIPYSFAGLLEIQEGVLQK